MVKALGSNQGHATQLYQLSCASRIAKGNPRLRRAKRTIGKAMLRIYIWASVDQESIMKVARWGNSLAIRLPASVVEVLRLKEGDDVEIHAGDDRTLSVVSKPEREELLARLEKYRGILPADFKFDREEANAR